MALFKAEKKQFTKNAGKWDVVISEDMCKACGFCLNVCPVDVFAWRKSPNKLGWVPMFWRGKSSCGPAMIGGTSESFPAAGRIRAVTVAGTCDDAGRCGSFFASPANWFPESRFTR